MSSVHRAPSITSAQSHVIRAGQAAYDAGGITKERLDQLLAHPTVSVHDIANAVATLADVRRRHEIGACRFPDRDRAKEEAATRAVEGLIERLREQKDAQSMIDNVTAFVRDITPIQVFGYSFMSLTAVLLVCAVLA